MRLCSNNLECERSNSRIVSSFPRSVTFSSLKFLAFIVKMVLIGLGVRGRKRPRSLDFFIEFPKQKHNSPDIPIVIKIKFRLAENFIPISLSVISYLNSWKWKCVSKNKNRKRRIVKNPVLTEVKRIKVRITPVGW